jgi:hypothetical protein
LRNIFPAKSVFLISRFIKALYHHSLFSVGQCPAERGNSRTLLGEILWQPVSWPNSLRGPRKPEPPGRSEGQLARTLRGLSEPLLPLLPDRVLELLDQPRPMVHLALARSLAPVPKTHSRRLRRHPRYRPSAGCGRVILSVFSLPKVLITLDFLAHSRRIITRFVSQA